MVIMITVIMTKEQRGTHTRNTGLLPSWGSMASHELSVLANCTYSRGSTYYFKSTHET